MTYIPLKRGLLYPVAIMDWASRKVLSRRLSNTLEASFCVEALEEALARYGPPEIFNTDQGGQFTSFDFLEGLKNAGVRVSMDGKGRWMDNISSSGSGARSSTSRSTSIHLSDSRAFVHHLTGRDQAPASRLPLAMNDVLRIHS